MTTSRTNKKFYIRLGRKTLLVYAETALQGCIKMLQRKEAVTTTEEDTYSIGTVFYVSERGFDEHEDDIKYTLDGVIQVMYMYNNGGETIEPSPNSDFEYGGA